MHHHPRKWRGRFRLWSFHWSSDCSRQPTPSITPDRFISREESIYQPKSKRSLKRVRTREGNGCNCENRKSPSEDYFWEALTVRNFHDQPLESREKPGANEKIQECPWKALLRLKAYFRQKRKASTSHIRVWREQNSETQFNLWARSKQVVKTEDFQMHHRPKSTKPNFFRSYVLAKAKSAATGMAIHSKERMYIVDSGASLHIMGLSSRNHREKKTVRHSSNKSGFSDRQWHCGLRHTREGLHQWTWRFSMDTCGERFSVSAIVLKTMQWTWLFFVADRRNSLTSSPWLQLSNTEGSTIHWILDSQGTPWERTRSGGRHAGSATTIYRRTGRTRRLFLNPDSWEWHYAWSCRRTISWWETFLGCHRCGERYSGRRYQGSEKNHRSPTEKKSQSVHSLCERSQLWSL